MTAAAVILTDTRRGRLGHDAALGDTLADRTVLGHTVARAASIPAVDRVVLVHPPGQDPLALLSGVDLTGDTPMTAVADPSGSPDLSDVDTATWVAARKWSMANWRGGLGFSTVFDELLPPAAVLHGMDQVDRDSALLLRGDWCAFDPVLAQQILERHLESPEGMMLCFSQAPPGLAGVAMHRSALEQLVEHRSAFGRALGYNPHKPGVDPIGREACLAVPPEVRDTARRFIYDTPRAKAMLQRLAARLGPSFAKADAATIARAQLELESESPGDALTDRLAPLTTLELTPRRPVAGPITPHHHVAFDRGDLENAVARQILDQLGEVGDVSLMLGGLGDALQHAGYREIVHAARRAGVMGLGIETDLHVDVDEALSLLDLPLDVVSVRLNADTAATYQAVMGSDAFARVGENLGAMVRERLRRIEAREPAGPWLAVKLIKTHDTLADMESFFERWLRSGAMAVIEPSCSGCGLMPELSPIPMAPPRREPCRQLGRRLTILSDGTVAPCDQDWLGRDPLGDATLEPLADIWSRTADLADQHRSGRYHDLKLCGQCVEWHRP